MELTATWNPGDNDPDRKKTELVIRMIRRRFGSLPDELIRRLDHLSSKMLDNLGEALFDFNHLADVELWLLLHHDPS